MAFVLALLCGVFLLVICGGDSAKKTLKETTWYANHRPRKMQEEYLLGCELFHKYRLEGMEDLDAKRRAMYEARKKIFDDGYRPHDLLEMKDWLKDQDEMKSIPEDDEKYYLFDLEKKCGHDAVYRTLDFNLYCMPISFDIHDPPMLDGHHGLYSNMSKDEGWCNCESLQGYDFYQNTYNKFTGEMTMEKEKWYQYCQAQIEKCNSLIEQFEKDNKDPNKKHLEKYQRYTDDGMGWS